MTICQSDHLTDIPPSSNQGKMIEGAVKPERNAYMPIGGIMIY